MDYLYGVIAIGAAIILIGMLQLVKKALYQPGLGWRRFKIAGSGHRAGASDSVS